MLPKSVDRRHFFARKGAGTISRNPTEGKAVLATSKSGRGVQMYPETGDGDPSVPAAKDGTPDSNPGPSLARALENTGTSVIYQNSELRILWAHNVPPAFSTASLVGAFDGDFLPAAQAARLTDVKRAVLETGRPRGLQIHIPAQDDGRWFRLWIDADASDGRIAGLVTTIVDITDQRHRDRTLHNLLREVSHRSKNLMAVIQSIANQTGRYEKSIEGFLGRFHGRLQSLASSQDLVTSANWHGVCLRQLVMAQTDRYVVSSTAAVRFEGDSPLLNPNATMHIGLALHELATNSARSGALARPGGRVLLTASTLAATDNASLQVLLLIWNEMAETQDALFEADDFGQVMLAKVVPLSLNAAADFATGPGRFEYRLSVPGSSYDIEHVPQAWEPASGGV